MTDESIQDDNKTQVEQEPDESIWWVASLIGVAVAAGGAFVLYETLRIFAIGTTAWVQCLQSDGGAFTACGDDLTFAYEYRYGVDALLAMGLALVAVFVGPVPVIATLNRYKNNLVAGVLFFLIMIPYGTLAFLVIIIAALALLFFSIQVV